MEKVLLVIQARMGSTRLPGKVMKEVFGRPLLSYLIERLRPLNSKIVVATSTSDREKPIVSFCSEHGISYFLGDEEDVLARFFNVACMEKAENLVRITADCPLLDYRVLDRTLRFYFQSHFDYVANTLKSPYPRGMDVEIFSKRALDIAFEKAQALEEREHVTLYFKRNPKLFRLGYVPYLDEHPPYRLTVDTKEDFILVKKIIEALHPKNSLFSLEDIVNFLVKRPKLAKINANIKQKCIT